MPGTAFPDWQPDRDRAVRRRAEALIGQAENDDGYEQLVAETQTLRAALDRTLVDRIAAVDAAVPPIAVGGSCTPLPGACGCGDAAPHSFVRMMIGSPGGDIDEAATRPPATADPIDVQSDPTTQQGAGPDNSPSRAGKLIEFVDSGGGLIFALEDGPSAIDRRAEVAAGAVHEDDVDEPEGKPSIRAGSVLYVPHLGVHYTVVLTTEGDPVLRPSKIGEL